MGLFVFLQDLSETKIGQAQVTIFFEQDIFWLEISVNNFLLVEMAEGEGNTHTVELGSCF